jgi:hypothetical protein
MSDSDSNLDNKSRHPLLKHESRLKISLLWFLVTSSQFPFSEKRPSIPFCDRLLANYCIRQFLVRWLSIRVRTVQGATPV